MVAGSDSLMRLNSSTGRSMKVNIRVAFNYVKEVQIKGKKPWSLFVAYIVDEKGCFCTLQKMFLGTEKNGKGI